MMIVGLTGGIGSGKSTVAEYFAKLGVNIIDTDVIAKQLVKIDQPAYHAIIKHFSDKILLSNRELDRAKLKQHIIHNDEDRLSLENILHPRIQEVVEEQIKNISASYCIVVIPLLVEKGRYPILDRVLVIDSPIECQIERVNKRDGLTNTDIEKLIAIQATRQQRLDAANDIIINDKGLAELTTATQQMHAKYLKL